MTIIAISSIETNTTNWIFYRCSLTLKMLSILKKDMPQRLNSQTYV